MLCTAFNPQNKTHGKPPHFCCFFPVIFQNQPKQDFPWSWANSPDFFSLQSTVPHFSVRLHLSILALGNVPVPLLDSFVLWLWHKWFQKQRTDRDSTVISWEIYYPSNCTKTILEKEKQDFQSMIASQCILLKEKLQVIGDISRHRLPGLMFNWAWSWYKEKLLRSWWWCLLDNSP